MPKVIQFIHPGGQYAVKKFFKTGNLFPWNTKDYHRRKFLEAMGQYAGSSGLSPIQPLRFWGEWEPESVLSPITPSPQKQKDYPNAIHIPKLILDPKTGIPQAFSTSPKAKHENSDPLVLTGDTFYYSLCQQSKLYKGQQIPTVLNSLDRGSLILFGSHIEGTNGTGYFALDTVFVVDEYKAYTIPTCVADLNGFVPPHYLEIMTFLKKPATKQKDCIPSGGSCVPPNAFPLRCYRGATFSTPVNGMFSFVPCKLSTSGGFGRLALTSSTIPDISNNLQQGFKIIHQNPQHIWQLVKAQAQAQGYLLGTMFKY